MTTLTVTVGMKTIFSISEANLEMIMIHTCREQSDCQEKKLIACWG
jgi:hypothetical protein